MELENVYFREREKKRKKVRLEKLTTQQCESSARGYVSHVLHTFDVCVARCFNRLFIHTFIYQISFLVPFDDNRIYISVI